MVVPPSWADISHIRVTGRDAMLEYFSAYVLFTWRWWLLLILSTAPFLIWWRLVDRGRLRELVLYGLFVTLAVFVLDTVGTDMVLWGYPYVLIPAIPAQLGVDLVALPVAYMLLYQWFSRGRPFFWAHLTFAFGAAFIAEPIFTWLGMWEQNLWRHYYSVPFYVALPYAARGFVRWVTAREREHQSQEKI